MLNFNNGASRGSTIMLCCVMTATGLGCVPPQDTPGQRVEQAGLPRAQAWGEFSMTRPTRTPQDVLERARLIAEIVLEDSDLPSPSLLDPDEVEAWAEAAAADPYREGALRFELGDHDVLVRYRPASDRLTVSTPDTTLPTQGTIPEPGRGLSLAEAQSAGSDCLDMLEERGVLGQGEFSRDHSYASERPTYVEGSESAWVGAYSFVYNPDLDGLPLTSAEVIVTVNASSGRCQRITVSGQVTLARIGDAVAGLTDETLAAQIIKDKVAAAAPVPLVDVHVQGHIGYYLPLTSHMGDVSPMYIASHSTQTGTQEQPVLTRGRLVGLPLVDAKNQGLVELLGPDW